VSRSGSIFSLTLENLHPSLDTVRFYILNSKNLDIYIILSCEKSVAFIIAI